MKPRKPIIKSRRAERFVASLLASLSLGHITSGYLATHLSDAPTQIPSLRSGTSDTRQPLSEIVDFGGKTNKRRVFVYEYE